MENAPKLRFEGFDGEWEKKTLGDISVFFDTMRKPLEGSKRVAGPYPYYGASGIVDYVDGYIFEEELVLLSEDGANILDRNYPVCFLATGKYWVNNHAHVLKAKEGNDNNFICNSLERKDYKEFNTGMAMPKLNKDVCQGIPVCCPCYEEQRLIGNILRNIDHLLTLHQRKYDALLKARQFYLQNLFPKKGEKVPAIRFAGFEGEWERKLLSEITFASGKRNRDNLDLEPYAITNESGFIPQNEAHDEFGYMKDTDRSAYIIVTPNSFGYNPARINVGSLGYYAGTQDVIVSSLYEVFQTTKEIDDRFLLHWFNTPVFRKWIGQLQEGSVRLYFYYDKLCECHALIPSLGEQERIADFLSSLDSLLALQSRKLETLKKMKQFMLQNLFV